MACGALVCLGLPTPAGAKAKPVRFITLAPGHFHAALVQKQMLPQVAPTVTVYAPLGFDLTEHIKRIVGFNTRTDAPTAWSLDVHAQENYLSQFRKEKRGSVVVISGRNAGKIELIETSVDGGMHVLVDKPWIIEPEDFGKLERVLAKAKQRGVLAYDIMTERFEPTNALQKELVNAPDVFGQIDPGTAASPGVYIENVHHFMKMVAGRPNIRPTWFFDSRQQGEGMADTGTHLVDLVQWTLAPDQALDAKRDIEVLQAQRWPTPVTQAQFRNVTATDGPWPAFLTEAVVKDQLNVFANTQVTYKLRGTFVQMASMWSWEAEKGGGDWHYAVYRGTRSTVEIRQGRQQKFVPELYVVPRSPADAMSVQQALRARLASLGDRFAGVSLQEESGTFHVIVPQPLRLGHEAHFGEVTRNFLAYLNAPRTLPAWESTNLLAKYWVTTQATKLSRQSAPLAGFSSKAPR